MRGPLQILLVLLILAAALHQRYGGGADFPDRLPGPPRLDASALEVVADLDALPGNIAVAAEGRVFATIAEQAPYPTLRVKPGRSSGTPGH